MSNSKYTPGPWQAKVLNGRTVEVVIKDAVRVADCGCRNDLENQANARLIAAAPDMLTLLKSLVLYLDGIGGAYSDQKRDVQDMIAKAEGRST